MDGRNDARSGGVLLLPGAAHPHGEDPLHALVSGLGSAGAGGARPLRSRVMRVWIDLANSPHVLFFAPLVREFERRGIEVICTARDFAQTLGLARLHGLRVKSIGRHGGKWAVAKGWAILARAVALGRFARTAGPDVAVSHNSYAQ